MFRKAIFWIHLTCGVLVAIVVLAMSVTGVLLTYERQIKRVVAESKYVDAEMASEKLPLAQLLKFQALARSELVPTSIILTNAAGAPVSLRAGRQGGVDLNPYNGSVMQVESATLNEFFGAITRFHRWFNVEGENRAFARQITGVSNTVFLFLVLSGMYLWLPAIWNATLFKARLLLRKNYPDTKARDFHWHHIFGIWMALPLAVVVYTGMVISYPWAANAMYRVFGAEIPTPPANVQQVVRNNESMPADAAPLTNDWLPLDILVAHALADAGSNGWNRLTVAIPTAADQNVQIEIDHGNGAQAHLRHTLSVDRQTGDIVGRREFSDQGEAQRLRGIARFLHTGEVLGFWGQTIAGLASLAGVLLVWTGLALAWRRLVQPYIRTRVTKLL